MYGFTAFHAAARRRTGSVSFFSALFLLIAASVFAAPTPGAQSFGYNASGQLGDGTTTDHYISQKVSNAAGTGALTKIVAQAGGSAHSLALAADGTVWAWGDNSSGALGDGTTTNRTVPVHVMANTGNMLTHVIAISAGTSHSLALAADGTVWAWGSNLLGQLGNGSTTDSQVAVPVKTLGNVTAIASGAYHSMALDGTGKVYVWGNDGAGELGNGFANSAPHSTPTAVATLSSITAIASGGYHLLAIRADGTAFAWGSNANKQLGDGTNTDRYRPVSVLTTTGGPAFSGVMAIAAGAAHSLLLSYGKVYAWGSNANGQIGDGTTVTRGNPTLVPGLSNVRSLAAGAYHNLALVQGKVYAWGNNYYGQLGTGGTTTAAPLGITAPVPVSGLGQVSAIAAGDFHTLITRTDTDGAQFAVGSNAAGQLGDNTTINRTNPVTTLASAGILGDIIATTGGQSHSLALTSEGVVYAWGDNTFGQLGDGTFTAHGTAKQVIGLPPIIALSAGLAHNIALAADNTVWTWGYNNQGQLGDGTLINRSTPVQVSNATGAIGIAAGGKHSLIVRVDGQVFGWGNNLEGELGDGTFTSRTAPTPVSGLTLAKSVGAGSLHSLAVTAGGSLYAWGSNAKGQLGDGTTVTRSTATLAATGTKAAAGGDAHTLRLSTDGHVSGVGFNGKGQLGNGTTNNSTAFVGPIALSYVAAIAAGSNHSLALSGGLTAADGGGILTAWGDNTLGQIGDGTTISRTTPVTVGGVFDIRGIGAGYNHTLIIAPQGASISGVLTFEGLVASAHAQNVTFILHPTDGTPEFTRTLSVPASGVYTLTNIARKGYDFWVKGPRNLAALRSADTSAGDITGINLSLPGGDADNTNVVDIGDFGVLVNAYGTSSTDGSYDDRADFNGDGVIDIADFGILVNNYGTSGPPVP